MKYSTQEKSPQSFVDEQHRADEFSRHEELHRSRELYKNPELFRSDELQEPKKQTLADKKKVEQERNVKLLSQYVAGIAAVAVAAVAVVAFPKAALAFEIEEETVGLTSFEFDLDIENPDNLNLHVLLTTADGQALGRYELTENGTLRVEGLYPETKYALCVLDEAGQEHFSHSFTTDPFVTLSYAEEGGRALLNFHEELSQAIDLGVFLYDWEGKDFSSHVYYDLAPGAEPPTDSDFDSTTDVAPEIPYAHYLASEGLYAGEYTLQAMNYLPEGEPIVYEKKLMLGDLQPLTYTATVDTENGEIVLTYLSGDLSPYAVSYVELVQGDTYYHLGVDYGEMSVDGDIVYIPIDPSWASGSYTLYLGGEFVNFFSQIWKCEIVI